jgi:hypothetical protein
MLRPITRYRGYNPHFKAVGSRGLGGISPINCSGTAPMNEANTSSAAERMRQIAWRASPSQSPQQVILETLTHVRPRFQAAVGLRLSAG